MIIKTLEKKQGKNGEYLALTLEDGKKANCFKQFEHVWATLELAHKAGESVEIQMLESKGFFNVVGIVGIEAPTPSGKSRNAREFGAVMDRKEKSIAGHVERKENAIVEAAIRRDAALFTSICWERFGGDKQTDVLKNAHEYWLKYFTEKYS